MTAVSRKFTDRWRSRNHVGNAAPVQWLEIRLGRFYRGYGPQWHYPERGRNRPYAIIPGSPNHHGRYPWQATWTPKTAWTQVPGLAQVDLQKSFENRGIGQATITLENIRMSQHAGSMGAIYHMIDRGYLSPWRGYRAPGRPRPAVKRNEWFEKLTRNAQVRVWQGYGPDTAVPVFTGLVDSVDLESTPDEAIITARDFGRTLLDQTIFGWNKDPVLKDPIVFADRQEYAAMDPRDRGDEWLQVDDASDVVRLALQWAGFKHWRVQKTGVRITGTTTFGRANTYMDMIEKMSSVSSFQFFIADPDPSDPESLGVPTWRYPRWNRTLDDTITVRDTDLLTGLKVTQTDDPLAYIIRVRGQILTGKKASQGITLEDDSSSRPMFVYRPPWTRDNRMSGILKHVTHTDDAFTTLDDCRIACLEIAAQEALQSATAIAQIPANPAIEPDSHVALLDLGTGISTRVYVSNVQSSFVSRVDSGWSWTMGFGGALIDTPDLVAIKREIRADNLKNDPSVRVKALRG